MSILLFILTLLPMSSNSLSINIIDRYTLSNQVVNDMVEDEDGYIWIGTIRGLNRFNGSTYKYYCHTDSLSIPNDFISVLCKDTDGRLWIGTTVGINLVRKSMVVPEVDVKCGHVSSISVLDDEYLLVMSINGLYRFNKNNKSISLVFQDNTSFGEAIIAGNGNIWIYDKFRSYVNILDKEYNLIKVLKLHDSKIKSVCTDNEGNVYLGCNDELKYFSPDGTSITLSKELRGLTDKKGIIFIERDHDSNIVIGIPSEGLFSFRGNGESLSPFWNTDRLENIQSGLCLLTRNNVFLSKNHRGIEYRYFSQNQKSIPIPTSDELESLNMFYYIGNGSLLILTNKNAYIKNLNTSEITRMKIEEFSKSDFMTLSLFDGKSELWLMKNKNTLCKYKIEGERMRLLSSFSVENSNSLWKGHDGGIYLLQDNGILHINSNNTATITHTERYPKFWFCGTTEKRLTYFLENNNVWFYDKDGFIKKMPVSVKNPECLYEDKEGLLWIGSEGYGITIYDPKSKTIENLTMDDGLPDNTTRSITGDRHGNIWVSSRCEVYKIERTTKEVTLVGNPEGMYSNYITNNCLCTDDGYVIFGSMFHLSLFKDNIDYNSETHPVILDGIILNGKAVRNIENPLVLEHGKNAISFYYSSMNFDPGTKLTYRYMLEGYNSDWINIGSSTRVSFSDLRKGKYTLKLNVQNSSGIWNKDTLTYSFKVEPPIWLSTAAIISYIIMTLAVIVFCYVFIRNNRANRKRIEQAEHDKLLVESLAKEKTDFFTNISHEYRTPLSLIYGPVKELSQNNSMNSRDNYLLSLVVHNTERMMKLTDEILEFYSHEKDSLKVVKSDVATLLKGMIFSFEYIFKQRKLTVNLDIPDNLKAYCDREIIERVFFNILSNAVKYTEEGGRVSIKAAISEDNLVIMVSDNGIGISPENIKRIFNRYDRAGAEKDRRSSGYGIGLNYAMELIHMHHGLITVSPNVPKGSIFTITVPARKASYSASEVILDEDNYNDNAIVANDGTSGIKSFSILVAEDNIELANYIKHLLIDDYNVILASNGNEAVECLKVSVPDLVISDIMMPFKDGLSLCHDIKTNEELSHLPVLLLTAKADMESQLQGLDCGADAYIKKPFDPVLLKKTVENIIENRKRMNAILMEKTSSKDIDVQSDENSLQLNSHDKAFIEKVHEIMEEHISDEEFNVTIMAKELNMSRTSLFTKIKTMYGVSPITFITDYKLNRAMEMLKTGDFNVSEVAYRVGFSTLTGFSRSFKNKFGIPPSSI